MSNELEPVGSVTLRGVNVPINSELGRLFIQDLARDADGIAVDLQQKWDLSDEAIADLETNEPLIRALRAEIERRKFNGTAAREIAAANLPAVVKQLVHMAVFDKMEASARRIDASKEIRSIASSGGDAVAGGRDPVQITIITGSDRKMTVEIPPPQPLPDPEPPQLAPITIEPPAWPTDDATPQ